MNAAPCVFLTVCAILLFIGTGDAYISCYSCNPKDVSNCTRGNITAAKQKACREVTHQFHYDNAVEKHLSPVGSTTVNGTLMCFSLYYLDKDNRNDTGIYRGCYVSTEAGKITPCEEIRETFSGLGRNGVFKQCHTCTGDLCNDHEVNKAASIMGALGLNVLLIVSAYILKF